MSNKWKVKDVITTVVLTVLLIVIQLIINMVCMANDFVSMVLSVGVTMLLCAPVYFLMVPVRCRHFMKRILSNRKHLDIVRFLTRRPAFYFIAFLIQNR